MALDYSQQILYAYRVNLYQPGHMRSGVVGQDTQYPTSPTLLNVPCYYRGTPEVDVNSFIGANKEFNIFTLDGWQFEATVPIAYGWLIQLTSHITQLHNVFWYVQGNTQIVPSLDIYTNNSVNIYAKRDPAPKALRDLFPNPGQ